MIVRYNLRFVYLTVWNPLLAAELDIMCAGENHSKVIHVIFFELMILVWKIDKKSLVRLLLYSRGARD